MKTRAIGGFFDTSYVLTRKEMSRINGGASTESGSWGCSAIAWCDSIRANISCKISGKQATCGGADNNHVQCRTFDNDFSHSCPKAGGK